MATVSVMDLASAKEDARKLHMLLEDHETGLFTWWEALKQVTDDLLLHLDWENRPK